jgi:urease accessory protein UreH/urease accessory protein UreF
MMMMNRMINLVSILTKGFSASELFAKYPCRLHLTTRPNDSDDDDETSPSRCRALTCYVLGYGGGLISGDEIYLNVSVKANAKLLITSQSTSKAFKAIAGRDATIVKTRARVAKGGLLFLVPQPMQCFGQSVVSQETEIVLEGDREGEGEDDSESSSKSGDDEDDPSLLLVDWYTGGRENLDGGLWQLSSFHTKTTISYSTSVKGETDNCGEDNDSEGISSDDGDRKCVFQDATRLSGGKELQRHMRDFRIVAMVILLGPKVEEVSSKFMTKYSSRRIYDEDGEGGNLNKGEGLNRVNEGLLVSCGSFNTCKEGKDQTGVVVRLASANLEIAGMFLVVGMYTNIHQFLQCLTRLTCTLYEIANFLSKEIGTLGGHLDDDPFLEILTFKQSSGGERGVQKRADMETHAKETKEPKISLELMDKSYDMNTTPITLKPIPPSKKETNQKVNPLILYQLVDSCVPSGGFAHSNTLEASHQLHLLNCDANTSWTGALYQHIWDVILNTATSTIPFLLSSSELFRTEIDANGIDKWEELDIQQRVMMTSHVASRASTMQGSGMLRAFSKAFPQIEPGLKALKKRVLRVDPTLADCTGHASTCFGAVCGMLGIDDETCCSMFLYTTARDMVNAAVRMNLIGPLEGGRLTNALCNAIEELLAQQIVPKLLNGDMKADFAHQVCPLIEILSNAHDRLYTRLFNS